MPCPTRAFVPIALIVAAGATAALAAATFRDRAGDVKGGPGPDLTAVQVSNTRTAITFRVHFSQAPPLRASASGRWVDMLLIGIDVPPRGPAPRPSGEWAGSDYAAGWHGTDRTGMVVKAPTGRKAPRWTKVAQFPVVTSGPTLRFSIRRAWIGNPASFDFVVSAGREMLQEGSTGGGSDSAPSRGTFHYRLTS